MSEHANGLGRRFWLLWTAVAGSNLADGLSLVAFPLLAIQLTDDARLVALVNAFRFVPFLLIGLPAGVIVDRFDRRRLAQVAQVGRGALVAAVALVTMFDAATMELLIGAAFVFGAGEVLTDAGLPALVRDLVRSDQLEVANSRISAVQTVTNVFIGPPLAAVLFIIHPSVPFWAAAVFGAVAALVLFLLPGRFRPAPSEDRDEPFTVRVTAGLRYVWNHPVLRPLALTVAVFAFVGEAGNAVFVVLATERFGLGELGFGVLVGVDGVISVLMSFLVAPLVARFGASNSMRLAVVTYAASGLLYGTSTIVAGALIGAVFGGISDPSWNVNSSTIRQRLVPDEIFGRMMTAYLFIAWGMQPLGSVMGGIIAESWGPQWVYILSGSVVLSLLVLARPLFRAIDLAMSDPPANGSGSGSDSGSATAV